MSKPGIITITLEGVTFEETNRCRKIIHKLFEVGFFTVRNGSYTANFDHEGNLRAGSITINWRDDKPVTESKKLEQFTIEMDAVDKSSVARSL